MTGFFWRALTLRDHYWHRRDFLDSLVAIRYLSPSAAARATGEPEDNWGIATRGVIDTGPVFIFDVKMTVEELTDCMIASCSGVCIGLSLDPQGDRTAAARSRSSAREFETGAHLRRGFGARLPCGVPRMLWRTRRGHV